MKLWFTYGISPGLALILVAVLGTILSLMTLCIDYAELSVGISANEHALESGVVEIGVAFLVVLELVLHVGLLGYGVIIQGNQLLLKAWIIAAGIYMLLWEIQLIWYLIEVLTAAVISTKLVLVLAYYLLYNAAFYCYTINLAVNCLPLFSSIVELEPIGKGLSFIVHYFQTHVRPAASFFLMMEIMLNLHVFLERHVTEYGLGFDFMDDEIDRSTALLLEETILRYARVGVCVVGFYLTFKEKQLWMFNWCLAYLITLTMSFGIFLYMIFMWRAVHGLLTLIYFSIFTLNLLFRTGVLYSCVRYTDVFERQGIPM